MTDKLYNGGKKACWFDRQSRWLQGILWMAFVLKQTRCFIFMAIGMDVQSAIQNNVRKRSLLKRQFLIFKISPAGM